MIGSCPQEVSVAGNAFAQTTKYQKIQVAAKVYEQLFKSSKNQTGLIVFEKLVNENSDVFVILKLLFYEINPCQLRLLAVFKTYTEAGPFCK